MGYLMVLVGTFLATLLVLMVTLALLLGPVPGASILALGGALGLAYLVAERYDAQCS